MATKVGRSRAREVEAQRLYQRADRLWSQGRMRSAFRLFLAAAQAGMVPAFRTVGQFYDRGDGVKANHEAARYWYRRAYRHGSESAANNIACIWRDRGKLSRAIWWFRRAVKSGDDDANLNIAKVYLGRSRNLAKAAEYLNKVCKSKRVTTGAKEEARQLLKKIGCAR
jgi:TPR repeat protein